MDKPNERTYKANIINNEITLKEQKYKIYSDVTCKYKENDKDYTNYSYNYLDKKLKLITLNADVSCTVTYRYLKLKYEYPHKGKNDYVYNKGTGTYEVGSGYASNTAYEYPSGSHALYIYDPTNFYLDFEYVNTTHYDDNFDFFEVTLNR